MGIQRITDAEVFCPLSHFTIGNQVIRAHKLPLIELGNGTLYAKCGVHTCRMFISDFATVSKIMANVKIIKVTEPVHWKQGDENGKKKKGRPRLHA